MTASSPIEVQTSGWTFVQIPIGLLNDPNVTDEAFRLFCKLATFANKEKRAWPSEETLAGEMGLSVRSIRNRIANLVKAGWLTQIRRKQASAVYLLESLPDRKNIAGLGEDRQEVADHKNEDRQEIAHLGNQDRQNLSIVEPNKTGKILPPNDSNTTIFNQALNDIQVKDSPAQKAAPEAGPAETVQADPPTPKPKRKRTSKASSVKAVIPKPEGWGDLVVAVIEHFVEPNGKAAKIAEQLAGVADPDTERGAHNCKPPAKAEDVGSFVKWYKANHSDADLPTSAETLESWWFKYQNRELFIRRSDGKTDGEKVYANGMTRAQAKAASAETVAAYQGENADARAAFDAIMSGSLS